MSNHNPFGKRPPINPRPDISWGQDLGTMGIQRGASPEQPPPKHTYRPFAGAPENNRGGAVVIQFNTTEQPQSHFNSIVQSQRDSGADSENIVVTLGYLPEWPVAAQGESAGHAVGGDLALPTNTTSISALYNVDLAPVAMLSWGIGGANFQAEVDWNIGTCFALAASSINVGLRFDQPLTALGAGSFKVTYAAALSYGGNGGRMASGCRRTIRLRENILPGTASTYEYMIPPFANSATILSADLSNAGTDLSLIFNRMYGTGLVQYRNLGQDSQNSVHENTFPIPNSARTFRVYNSGGQTVTKPLVVFNLAFS